MSAFLDRVLARLSRPVLARLDGVIARLKAQDARLHELGAQMRRIDSRVDALERDVRDMRRQRDNIVALRREVGKLRGEVERIAQSADDLRKTAGPRGLTGQTRLIGRDVRALLRRTLVAPAGLPHPQRLASACANVISQNGGDGILLALLEAMPALPKTFVDIGSGAAGGATAVLSRELGWRGLMIDGSTSHAAVAAGRFPSARVATVGAFVTAENVNDLVRSHAPAGDIGVLAIDIDGVDYWLWRALDVCRPAIVVVEYNAFFGLSRAVTVPYTADFTRPTLPGPLRRHYMGASLPAFVALGREKGYRLVATDDPGLNAFFVRDDAAPEIPACALDALPYQKSEIGKYPDIYAVIAKAGLPLVDVG